MEAELEALEGALAAPGRPLAAIVGGAKISTKLDLLGNLLHKVDMLAVGGAMANTFLHALGTDVGASLCERGMSAAARAILADADAAGCEIALPSDVVVARALEAGAPAEAVPIAAVPRDAMILDLGPATAAALSARLENCRTLVWNGPLGAFEVPPFDAATVAVARQAAELTRAGVAAQRGGRRRYPRRARPCRGRGRLQLPLDRRRGVPRMAGGQDAPGRRGARRVGASVARFRQSSPETPRR